MKITFKGHYNGKDMTDTDLMDFMLGYVCRTNIDYAIKHHYDLEETDDEVIKSVLTVTIHDQYDDFKEVGSIVRVAELEEGDY